MPVEVAPAAPTTHEGILHAQGRAQSLAEHIKSDVKALSTGILRRLLLPRPNVYALFQRVMTLLGSINTQILRQRDGGNAVVTNAVNGAVSRALKGDEVWLRSRRSSPSRNSLQCSNQIAQPAQPRASMTLADGLLRHAAPF